MENVSKLRYPAAQALLCLVLHVAFAARHIVTLCYPKSQLSRRHEVHGAMRALLTVLACQHPLGYRAVGGAYKVTCCVDCKHVHRRTRMACGCCSRETHTPIGGDSHRQPRRLLHHPGMYCLHLKCHCSARGVGGCSRNSCWVYSGENTLKRTIRVLYTTYTTI